MAFVFILSLSPQGAPITNVIWEFPPAAQSLIKPDSSSLVSCCLLYKGNANPLIFGIISAHSRSVEFLSSENPEPQLLKVAIPAEAFLYSSIAFLICSSFIFPAATISIVIIG